MWRFPVKEEIKVTNSEWYVMNCLWEKSHLSLMQLVPLLKESAGWSKSTSATMVRRMTEKDLIGYEENGKTKYFFPKVKKQDVVVQETRDFLQRIYDGSVGMMMSALVRQNDLSQEDILELQEILKAAQTKTQKTKRKG
ncbi:MAG TPA: transcriptional regulator [Lachnospiraceae bacterium]|nr:BlaI/MecI/CopY family transcriptional regulator [Roseburia sp. AM59-24XD]HCS14707.1 transcriptional regulator [Lachnospiraceae bacterium]